MSDETTPPGERSETAALFTLEEMLARVRAAIDSKNEAFTQALFVVLNHETPRERDDARKVCLLELIAVDLTAPAPLTDVPAPAMPGTVFAQRPPTFR